MTVNLVTLSPGRLDLDLISRVFRAEGKFNGVYETFHRLSNPMLEAEKLTLCVCAEDEYGVCSPHRSEIHFYEPMQEIKRAKDIMAKLFAAHCLQHVQS